MKKSFDLVSTPLTGLTVLQRKPKHDCRGHLERLFCTEEMRELTCGKPIVQVNRTLTIAPGTVRGMHFQHPPHTEIKLLTCLRGKIFDVAVDIRQGSQTFLRWHAEVLCGEDLKTIVVPEGFAHGFQALSENCELFYLHTACYQPNAEDGLSPIDPALAITWPLPISELSGRDASFSPISTGFVGIRT